MDKESARIASKFAKNIRKKFKINKIILFGSRARGDNLLNSDFDFLVVSSDFEGVFFTDRIAKLYLFWEDYPLNVEPLCYTPKEFKIKLNSFGIVRTAVKEGIEI